MTRGSIAVACLLAGLAACTQGEDAGSGAESTEALIGVAPPDPIPACVATMTDEGHSPVCASCACGRCAEPAEACTGGGDDPALCARIAQCQQENECVGMRCYCGPGVGALLCLTHPQGPCAALYREAAGSSRYSDVKRAVESGALSAPLTRASALTACVTREDRCATQCTPAGESCHFDDEACQERLCGHDEARETDRAASATTPADPTITALLLNGTRAWEAGDPGDGPVLRPGDVVTLEGRGFGSGADIDFAKIMIGNSRVLETDLRMFEQKLNIFTQTHHETATTHSTWDRDLLSWEDDRIEIRVPVHASGGPIRVQVQKRIGRNASLLRLGEPHEVVDAQTLRVEDEAFPHECDVVSELSLPVGSNAVPVRVDNPEFTALRDRGEEIFWSYDYNIGLSHDVRGLDWTAIFDGEAVDPVTGAPADPLALFGAYPTVRGEVPDVAIDEVHFAPYPQPNPIPGFLAIGRQKTEGNTWGTGYVGYRYAESNHPFKGGGAWIGFNCASCHGYRVEYERAPGETIARVMPGLPNPRWSMKWTLLGDFEGVIGEEPGPARDPAEVEIDKTALLYAMPAGAGEHNVVRMRGEGSHTDNDYQFSPIAIPNVTNYMPIRRSLSHTESYVGFEGSYIHSQEPDGALGSMRAESLQALTAYMTQLDRHDDDLRNVGLYRYLVHRGEADSLLGDAGEGEVVQRGWRAFPELVSRVDAGAATFAEHCASCHGDTLGAHTNERMIRLDQVGHFFTPTIYQRHTQSVRATFLRNLYWVQHRGLLTDGHVRNLEDLVDPDRCVEGTALYDRYYTLHPPVDLPPAGPDFPETLPGEWQRGDVFRVARAPEGDEEGARRNRFVERHDYFVTVPWDPEHYYWDYQRMRAEYGPEELGTAGPIGMPAAPHPWCAGDASEVENLVLYLLTL